MTSKEYLENLEYYKKKYIDVKIIYLCTIKENDKYKYYPLQFDDKITNYK